MLNNIAIGLIKFYKRFLSIDNMVGKRVICRFEPTCSTYGLECYQRFGFFKATYLTIYRIIRCNPFSKGGYDPVPEK
jgi:putative membrane protein insertion efficiency factor